MISKGMPSAEEMEADIAVKKTWKRETMPHAKHARAYMIQTHQVHYYDELLHDIQASNRRKRGWLKVLKEFFEPYRPADHDTIVSGAYKTNPRELVKPGAKQPGFFWEFCLLLAILIGFCQFVRALVAQPANLMTM